MHNLTIIMLHGMPVAVANSEERARQIAAGIRAQGSSWGPREVKLCSLALNEWPEEWAGEEPR